MGDASRDGGGVNMPDADKERICFVIAPIGDEGSPTRERSDTVLNYVITPAVAACGYTPLRADKISESGMITSQIIQHLIEDPLVVADLTDHNPNVFYELAVRHAAKKPVVHIIEASQPKPFDVAGMRIIPLDYRDLPSANQCKEEIARQVQAAEGEPSKMDNPISQAIDLQTLRGSENPWEKSTAQILSRLEDIEAVLDRFRRASLVPSRRDPDSVRRLREAFDRLDGCLTLERGQRPTKRLLKEAQGILHQARAEVAAEPTDRLRDSIRRAFFSSRSGLPPSLDARALEEWLLVQPLPRAVWPEDLEK
jgi:hypothetical protein